MIVDGQIRQLTFILKLRFFRIKQEDKYEERLKLYDPNMYVICDL